ncbi:MAG: choice-of-anchor tandem repeat GloVer-containing protein [Verrucomicrobiota bacterium]
MIDDQTAQAQSRRMDEDITFSLNLGTSTVQILASILRELPLKALMALLMMTSASLVGAQTLQTLCSFNGDNGKWPQAELTLGNDGNFYGACYSGGNTNPTYPLGQGTVFKVTTNGNLTRLLAFNGSNGRGPMRLTLGNDGNFYGATDQGGSSGYGTVFKVTASGTLTTLVNFTGTNGKNPGAGLTLGNDGNFYGTTGNGGSSGYGTVFKMTPTGTFTTLVNFNWYNGWGPQAELTLGNDGNFYGSTYGGGNTNSTYPSGQGTLFKMTPSGTLTTLAAFNGNNGVRPTADLTLGNDGNFYGATSGGGIGYGTAFKVTPSGTLTTLINFNSANGAAPNAMTLGKDGNFYGTTGNGGSSGYGTVFKMTPTGTFTTLVNFNWYNGSNPNALTLGNDGNFYGTTTTGGSSIDSGRGTVFRLLVAPVVIVQPQSQTNNAGTTATFSVSVTGAPPLSYQWRKDGVNISGATSSTLTISNVKPANIGYYCVVVSNPWGTVPSANASLTIPGMPSGIWQGLVAFYPFNSNANDESGMGNNGGLYGSDWRFSSDRFGGANSLNLNLTLSPSATLDGSYVSAPRSPGLDFQQDFTLSAWVKLRGALPPSYVHNIISSGQDLTSGNLRIISDIQSGGTDYLQFVCIQAGDANYNAVEVPAIRNMWWQFVAVRSGTNVSLFRNGVLVAHSVMTMNLQNNPTIWLGKHIVPGLPPGTGSYSMMGGIDDVRMYNRALSSNEVAQLYFYENPPALGIMQQGGNVQLSWPVAYSNYSLLGSAVLTGGQWVTNTSPQTISGSNITVTLPATNSPMFYRLKSGQ